jgi:uncharacterized protein
MSALSPASDPMASAQPSDPPGVRTWIKQHPLLAYFLIAFAATWLCMAPIVVSQRGLNLLALPEEVLGILFILSTFIGPTPAAFIVTGVIDGKAGMRQLLRRMGQWRVGIQWYLLVLLGYPVLFLLGLAVVFGAAPFSALLNQWPLLLTYYLPAVLYGLVFPALGEEPGWRGFALPRMQRMYGPLLASLILGALHALWHLPAYMIPGAISANGWDPLVFAANSLAIMASTFVWTWLFNNAKGSVLFAMLFHSTSNAVSGLIPNFIPANSDPGPFYVFAVMGVAALVVIIITRGRLSYHDPLPAAPAGDSGPAALPQPVVAT